MSTLHANVLLLLAAMFWGAGNVAQKSVLDDLGPLTTVGLRCLMGAAVILPLLLRECGTAASRATAGMRSMIVAALLFTAAIASQQFAFSQTSVTNGSFLIATTTVMTPAVAWLLLREPPAVILWPAIALTLLGVFLLGGSSFTALNWGDLCALGSALVYSVWIVHLGPLVARTGRPGAVTCMQFIAAGSLCLVVGLAAEPFAVARLGAALPELVVLGVFATGLAYVFQAIAQQRTSPSIAAIIMSAECVFGALGGHLVLGERLGLVAGLGAALILAAILLVQIAPTPAHAGARRRPATARRGTALALPTRADPKRFSRRPAVGFTQL